MPALSRSSKRTLNTGAYIGVVRELRPGTPPGAMVEVATLTPGHRIGPARYPDRLGPATETTPAGDPAHVHQHGRPLAVHDEVIVAFLAGHPDRPVILDRLA